jgi:predicted ribosome quality control (RQC) complex YloA/Tae2 family protein
MQPFDALTMQAVLEEAKPLLLNRRVAEINQVGRDEVVIAFRNKAGQTELLLSAHAVYGRLCLTKTDTRRKQPEKSQDRSQEHKSGFVVLLRKYLGSATLVGIDQAAAERVVDFVFSCVDEVGGTSLKVLTAEIMGRHGNLIFWNHGDKSIIAASHFVTKVMSRHREVLIGAPYIRPPAQEKANAFSVSLEDVRQRLEEWLEAQKNSKSSLEGAEQDSEEEEAVEKTPVDHRPTELLIESFLVSNYAGLGRHLAREIVHAAFVDLSDTSDWTQVAEKLWQMLGHVKNLKTFRPAMKKDISGYTILSLGDEQRNADLWKPLPTVNDLVDEYYRTLSATETYNQTRERMLSESRSEVTKAEARLKAASDLISMSSEVDQAKAYGDLILAHVQDIQSGQAQLQCTNFYADPSTEITIALNPNLSAVQNAQYYYRQFAKGRSRQRSAKLAWEEANERLTRAQANLETVEKTTNLEELNSLRRDAVGVKQPAQSAPNQSNNKRPKAKMKLLTLTSSDGWTIYVGRNRHENDYLLSRVAQPLDVWLHILGQSGAHVLVKVTSSKHEPPLATLKEAAQVAARFSKTPPNSKVRVVYTQCKNLRKAGSSKPGVVRYENEKTLEVDTADLLPKFMKQALASS